MLFHGTTVYGKGTRVMSIQHGNMGIDHACSAPSCSIEYLQERCGERCKLLPFVRFGQSSSAGDTLHNPLYDRNDYISENEKSEYMGVPIHPRKSRRIQATRTRVRMPQPE